MASFELQSSGCDGHIRALSKAILMASKISKEALLEFTPDKMRLCARTDLFLVKFVFNREFFHEYRCDSRHRCYINLKALLMPFKSSILVADRDNSLKSHIRIKCSVEDEVNNQIVFKIGAEPPAATLTYRLSINDLDPERMAELNAINRTIDYKRVEIAPKQGKRDRFLLSAFNSFAPDIDQVTIKTTQNEVKFIGSTSPLLSSTNTTSEFTHKREDFSTFAVKEDLNITIPLRNLKLFLSFVETSRVQIFPKYVFEGMGLPAHFIYDASIYRGHFVTSTPYEYVPDELEDECILPIDMGPNESFIADENTIHDDIDENYDNNVAYNEYLDIEGDECDDEDGYNDNQSDVGSDFLDGNLEGLNATAANNSSVHYESNSIFGAESIRSEINDFTYDPEKVREVLDPDHCDPDEYENVEIHYSSDSSDD